MTATRYYLGKSSRYALGDFDPIRLIDSIELKSEYTPQPLLVAVNTPSDPNTNAQILSSLRMAKPEIIFHLNSGLGDRSFSPYGVPGPTRWNTYLTYAEIAGAVTLGLLAYAVIDLAVPKRVSK